MTIAFFFIKKKNNNNFFPLVYLMWEMFDPDFDCGNECGPGPPPVFFIPAPPRPPFLSELTKCSEDVLIDIEMCEAIPVSFF